MHKMNCPAGAYHGNAQLRIGFYLPWRFFRLAAVQTASKIVIGRSFELRRLTSRLGRLGFFALGAALRKRSGANVMHMGTANND